MDDDSPQTAVYLDHAATTPMSPAAVAAYVEAASQVGNASSLHAPGRAARTIVEESREQIAACLGAAPSEVIFTSGGTEANNLAVQGLTRAWLTAHGRRVVSTTATSRSTGLALAGLAQPPGAQLLVSAIEHHSVLEAAHWLGENEPIEVGQIPVDRSGRIDLDWLTRTLRQQGEEIALVSVMWANNEVGAIQPIAEVAALAAEAGVAFHTDAVQAIGQVPVDFEASGADALSVSAHKFGGPLGVGALLVKRGLPLEPLLHGGGHELGRRSGTLNVPGIRAFAVALVEAVGELAHRAAKITKLRNKLIAQVKAAVPDAVLLGPVNQSQISPQPTTTRLPSIATFLFPGADGDALTYLLDSADIAASNGAACTAGVGEPSHVLLAMGYSESQARSAIRFSLASTTTEAEVAALVAALPSIVATARAATG